MSFQIGGREDNSELCHIPMPEECGISKVLWLPTSRVYSTVVTHNMPDLFPRGHFRPFTFLAEASFFLY